MKLRIRGNSIRLRLTQSEVVQLATEGHVQNVTSFGNAELKYAVVISNSGRMEADLRDNEITVCVPQPMIAEWAASEQIGIAESQAVRDDELQILVEKDFACIKPRHGEEDSDTFTNPLAAGNG